MSEFGESELAEKIHDHLNDTIQFADRKASIVLYADLTFLVIVGSVLNNFWAEASLGFKLLSATSITSALVGAAFAGLTIYPRTSNNTSFFLWETIVSFNKCELKSELSEIDEETALGHLLDDVYNLSGIAEKKYRQLRLALLSTAVMVSSAVLGGVILLN